jgi:hypothetical protein
MSESLNPVVLNGPTVPPEAGPPTTPIVLEAARTTAELWLETTIGVVFIGS